MKIHLFQELLALNEEFGHVINGLERMEKGPTYKKEMIRWAKAHVQSAQVEANRQFFDEFDAIVENDAIGVYRFLRDHRKRVTDPDDVYLEIKHREEARKAKGLPPRVAILPDWRFGDEKRYEEEQAERKKRAAKRRRKTTKKRTPKLAKPPQRSTTDSQPNATPTRDANFERAGRVFRAIFQGLWNPDGPSGLLHYFHTRRTRDEKNYSKLSDDIAFINEGKERFSSPELENLYRRWRAGEIAGNAVRSDSLKFRTPSQVSISFSTVNGQAALFERHPHWAVNMPVKSSGETSFSGDFTSDFSLGRG
jgi:hypothetical protein